MCLLLVPLYAAYDMLAIISVLRNVRQYHRSESSIYLADEAYLDHDMHLSSISLFSDSIVVIGQQSLADSDSLAVSEQQTFFIQLRCLLYL